jgi:predicted LPLAT superfamily acyltransferase
MASKPAESTLARPRLSQWAREPERGSTLVLRLGVFVALRLGRPLARLTLHLVTAYFFVFAPSARRASRAYLRRVLGREPSARDRYRQIDCFGATLLDRLYFLKGRHELFEIAIEGEPLMLEMLTRGQGAFLLGSHLGSFAPLSAIGRRRPELKVAMAMYEAQAGPLNTFFSVTQAQDAPEIIPLGHLEAMLRIRDCLDAGKFVGILADRTLADAPAQPVPFLGRAAPFPVGPMRVAAALRRPVIFMTALYRGDNRYFAVFHRIADFSQPMPAGREAAVREAIVRYAQLLEQYTRSDPYNWFNFYDFWQGAAPVDAAAAHADAP